MYELFSCVRVADPLIGRWDWDGAKFTAAREARLRAFRLEEDPAEIMHAMNAIAGTINTRDETALLPERALIPDDEDE